jgi:hypothetical protein
MLPDFVLMFTISSDDTSLIGVAPKRSPCSCCFYSSVISKSSSILPESWNYCSFLLRFSFSKGLLELLICSALLVI